MNPGFRAFVLAAFSVTAGLPAIAAAVEIASPDGHLLVDHDGALWRATIDGNALNFDCIAPACGGDQAGCTVAVLVPEGGKIPEGTQVEVMSTMVDDAIKRWTSEGATEIAVVEPAALAFRGFNMGLLASLKAQYAGDLRRFTYFYIIGLKAIAYTTCIGPEAVASTSAPAFDDLFAGITLTETP